MLTNGISSCLLSERTSRTSTFKEREEPWRIRTQTIMLLSICVKQTKFGNNKAQLTVSLRSWPRSPLEDWLDTLSRDFSPHDKVLRKEFMNGSEFFRMKGFPKVGGFIFPPNFHEPLPPPCFHLSYDLSARTQFTTLADFPPCKFRIPKNVKEESVQSKVFILAYEFIHEWCFYPWTMLKSSKILQFSCDTDLFEIRGFKSWKPHFLHGYKKVSDVFKVLKCRKSCPIRNNYGVGRTFNYLNKKMILILWIKEVQKEKQSDG